LPGHVLVIRLFFFFFLAGHANRLMVINRQEPPVLVAQRLAASLANHGTGKLLLPILFHVRPPPMFLNTVIAVVKKTFRYARAFLQPLILSFRIAERIFKSGIISK
jgi:hypothetical protein